MTPPLPSGAIAPAQLVPFTVGHAWQFISSAVTTQGPLAGAANAALPTGIQANDLLHISLMSSPDIAPAGWTKLFGGNVEAFWRVATADANDNFSMPVGTDPETGRIVIFSVFRRSSGVPDEIAVGSGQQIIGGGMNIAPMVFNQPTVIEPILIVTTVRGGQNAVQSPIYTNVPSPWRTVVSPVYVDWGVTPFRFNYLGTAYQLEADGSAKSGSSYNFAQFEGGINTATDSRGARWDIV